MEQKGRKAAKEQAGRAKPKERATESAEMGAQAAVCAKAVKDTLNMVKPYYEYAFTDRFIKVPVDSETGQPTEDGLAAVRAELQT